jgi:heme oxygenase
MMQPSPASQTYVARVQEVALTQPYLLVAHQYTRYLGDLFGTYYVLLE